MPKFGYKFLNAFKDRYGNQRCYFRRGRHNLRLPTPIGGAAFLKAYQAALDEKPQPDPGLKRAHELVKIATNGRTPKVGVYILMNQGFVAYIGSSLDMPRRVAGHRTNGRPFDRALYIATEIREREEIERALIAALKPPQNRR